MNTVAFYDAKPYDRQYFERADGAGRLRRQFHEFRLTSETAASVNGAQAVCVFVNDRLDAPCLEQLHKAGVRLVALRCAGFNNVDLTAAKALGFAVTRVPAYSPHAVAEHTVGLLLTLNRVREHNFSLAGLVGFDVAGKTIGIVGTGKSGKSPRKFFTVSTRRCSPLTPRPRPRPRRTGHGSIASATRSSTRCWPRAMSSRCTCRSRRHPVTCSTRRPSRG